MAGLVRAVALTFLWSTGGYAEGSGEASKVALEESFPLKVGQSTVVDGVRVDVFQPEPGVYILRQGKRWYVAETKDCRMQQFEDEPPEPGEYLGAFRVKNNVFAFVPASDAKNGKGAEE